MAVIAKFSGFDLQAIIGAAGAVSVGQQKAKYASEVILALGSSPVFEILNAGAVRYRTTLSAPLTASSQGIVIPEQFIEPPSVNIVDPLTSDTCVLRIHKATNSAVAIEVPVKVGGTAAGGFLAISVGLDGTRVVRTSGFVLLAPATLDITGGAPGTVTYARADLISDMTLANENSWGLELAPNTQTGTSVYAQITVAINRADGDSGYPNAYLSDNSLKIPGGTVAINDTSNINLMGWLVAGRAIGSGVSSTRSLNSRLQLRRYKLIAYLRNGTYLTLDEDDASIIGASWHADFKYPGAEFFLNIEVGGALYQARVESSANGGGESLGSIGSGNWGTVWNPARSVNLVKFTDFTLHTYPVNYTNTRKWWVDNVRAVIQSVEARLILHDPTGTDDRANANILIWSGADWRVGGPTGQYISDGAGVGRLKLVPANGDWRVFSWNSVPSTIINATPPPGWS